MLKKIVGWLFLAFVLWFFATQPVAAASTLKAIGGGLGAVAHGLSTALVALSS